MFDWDKFEVGCIVTRTGTDMHEVLEAEGNGQLIKVKCIKPDDSGVYEINDIEDNLARRYTLYGKHYND